MTNISYKTVLKLMKLKVSVAVTFTAIAGFIMYSHSISFHLVALIMGVLLLASGSSALNQVQEAAYDILMPRTSMRPIPAGNISKNLALTFSILFIVTGTLILFFYFDIVPAFLGLLNVLWYNGIYTPLKRLTAFAVVPGSLVGAIPALIGWTAAGGYWMSATIIFVALFLFIWQVPHFWLLMLKYGEEYKQAGFKTVTGTFSAFSMSKVIFVWVLCTSFSSLIVPLFLVKLSLSFFLLVFILNLVFISLFVQLAFNSQKPINFKRSFIGINIYMMVFMLFLIGYHLL